MLVDNTRGSKQFWSTEREVCSLPSCACAECSSVYCLLSSSSDERLLVTTDIMLTQASLLVGLVLFCMVVEKAQGANILILHPLYAGSHDLVLR